MQRLGVVQSMFDKAKARASETTATAPRPGGWLGNPQPIRSAPKPWVGQIVAQAEGGSIPRPHPIRPVGGVVRRWHLTPWKTTEKTALLDDLEGSNLGEDEAVSVGGWDVLNTLVGQAGSIFGADRGLTPYQPRPGQYLPTGTTYTPGGLGLSTNTLLMLGAGAVALLLLTRKK